MAIADRLTGHGIVFGDDHANVHNGIAYAAWNYAESIADDGTLLIEFNTPSDTYVHFKRLEFGADRFPWLVEIVEAPTLTTGASAITAYNRLRTSSNTCDCTLKSNPTVISGGTVIEAYYAGGGNGVGGRSSADSRSTDLEVIFKKDTTYLIRATNISGDTALGASLWAYWYEEDEG